MEVQRCGSGIECGIGAAGELDANRACTADAGAVDLEGDGSVQGLGGGVIVGLSEPMDDEP